MKLVIFDLDGTLLNSLEDLAVSANYALRKFGYQEHVTEDYRYMVGNGITKLIERALPEDARTENEVMHVRAEFVAYYSGHMMDKTKPYPGIPELLKELKHRGLILAVASNKYQDATRELIRTYFGDGIFQVVLGQREGVPAKPDPAIVNEILGTTGADQDDTLYIGDSCVDMQTAINSGVTPVGVTWGFRLCRELMDNGAVHIVDRPEDILKYIGE